MAQITINEGLAWLKTLKKRHEEILALRNDNAHRERRFYGASADKEIVKEPVYAVKVLVPGRGPLAFPSRPLRHDRRESMRRPHRPIFDSLKVPAEYELASATAGITRPASPGSSRSPAPSSGACASRASDPVA